MIFSLGGPFLASLPAALYLLELTATLPLVARPPTAMQVARKVPTDDPQVLFYLRIAYISIRACASGAWQRGIAN